MSDAASVASGPRRTVAVARLRGLLRLLTWCVLAALAALLVAAVVVPRAAGATPYAVLTGSMRPVLSPGTLVVVRPVDVESIGVGAIVTYQLESGRAATVTHRVVALDRVGGERVLRTQGDANPVPDAGWVRPVQVRGTVWYAIPWAGHAAGLLGLGQRTVLVWGVGGALAVYGLALIGVGLRERRSRHAPGSPRHRDEIPAATGGVAR